MPSIDLGKAVELAPRVWWVGSLLPGDYYQCHVYLIEKGDQSVIIDPGSALNAEEVIRRIDAVVGVDHVRWLVCSHADTDIIGALPALVAHGLHPDAVARAAAERLRTPIATPATGVPPVTASVGVALRGHGEGCDPLVARADPALYRAKAEGRDRVAVAD